jgi:hypothetical protein
MKAGDLEKKLLLDDSGPTRLDLLPISVNFVLGQKTCMSWSPPFPIWLRISS